jgi:hypothetical protein
MDQVGFRSIETYIHFANYKLRSMLEPFVRTGGLNHKLPNVWAGRQPFPQALEMEILH